MRGAQAQLRINGLLPKRGAARAIVDREIKRLKGQTNGNEGQQQLPNDSERSAGYEPACPISSSVWDSSTPQPITDNPDAMQLVDQLKQMGYSADDVAQAMGDDDQSQSGGDNGAMATKAAPLQIPSMG